MLFAQSNIEVRNETIYSEAFAQEHSFKIALPRDWNSISHSRCRRSEKIKEIVGAPEDYEFTCLLTMGYPAENAFLPRQKEIDVEERIHTNVW